jgi:LysM repeat protein
MRHWKRLFYYLIINVLVSACTVFAVLFYWESTHPDMPILSQINPFAEFTPLPPRVLFPNYGSALESVEPTGAAIEVTEIPASLPPTEIPQAEMEYTVQTGDTLGEIAIKFSVTVAEILEANEIPNPDSLVVGQVLIIRRPLVAVGTQTSLPPEEAVENEPATATQPAPENTLPPPVTGDARVTIDSVIGAGDLASERVFIKRVGPGEISLEGWQLVSDSGEAYTFPQITLFERGALYIYSRAGLASVVALYWELDHPVWESGDTVSLVNNQGETHASYQIP